MFNHQFCHSSLYRLWKSTLSLFFIFSMSLLTSVAQASQSEYEKTIIKNMKVVKEWKSHIESFPRKANLPPPGDVKSLAKAISQLHLAFHDQHMSDNEAKLQQQFNDMIIKHFPDQYRVIQARINETHDYIKQHLSSSNPNEVKNAKLYISVFEDMAQWHLLALPVLLYEGNNPYHDMYSQVQGIANKYSQQKLSLSSLQSLKLPSSSDNELGSKQVISLAQQRENERANRLKKDQEFEAQRQSDVAKQQQLIDEEIARAKAAAQVALEQAQAQIDVANYKQGEQENNTHSGFSFLWTFILGAGLLSVVYFNQHRLPSRAQQWISKTINPLVATLMAKIKHYSK